MRTGLTGFSDVHLRRLISRSAYEWCMVVVRGDRGREDGSRAKKG